MDEGNSSLVRHLTGLQDPDAITGFLEIAFEAVVTYDAQGHITSWNPAAERMLGWTAQEVLGKTSAELFLPVSTPQDQESQKERQLKLQQGETLYGEQELRRKDGSSLVVQYAARALTAGGDFHGYLAIYRDISSPMAAHEKNAGSKDHVARIFSTTPDAQSRLIENEPKFSALFDKTGFAAALSQMPNGILVDVNEAWTNMFGYTRQEAIGKTTLELNINPDVEGRERILAQIREQGAAHNIEITLRRKTGERLDVVTNVDIVEISGEKYILNTVQDITERKQAERALRASEARYRSLFDSAMDAIIVADPFDAGKVVSANPAAYRMFGYSPEEFIKLTREDILDTNDPNLAALFQQREQSGHGSAELIYKRKDGTTFSGELSSVLYQDNNGAQRSFAIIRDVTERKKVEDQLRELSQRLTYHVDNSPLAVIEWGSDMRLIRWSHEAEKMFGWKAEEVLGKRMEDFRWIYDKDTEQVEVVSSDLKTGVDPKRFSANRNYRKDGSVAYCEWYNSSLVDEAGNLRSILSLVLDVTDRMHAQQELAESEERYRHLVKHAPAGIYEIDLATMRFAEVNDSMCRILGYTRQELLSMTPDELLNEEGRGRFRERMLRTLAGEKVSQQTDYIVKAKDGHEIWGTLNTTINYQDGKPKSVSVIAHDITERKLAEIALQENQKQLQYLNETLEQKVHEKTSELRRLASDLTKAEQRERYRISHILHDDLQQRIYAIQMHLKFLHTELQAENARSAHEVSDIEEQLDELLKITRHLSIDLNPPILRDEGLSQAIHWLASQMWQRYELPIEIRADGLFAIPNEELHVLLFNCVRELLFNIVKHAEASRAVVSLQWSGINLRIEICDNGRGFPVNSSEQTAGEGRTANESLEASFGLSTIQHQLSLFGGQMVVQSEPGNGTQITLIVPITQEA